MKNIIFSPILFILIFIPYYGYSQAEIHATSQAVHYPWLNSETKPTRKLSDAIKPPNGYRRITEQNDTLTNWFRNLPLMPKESKVLLYNGQAKNRQDVHEAIIKIDIGKRDLQQCADAVMRLRAEYLYSLSKYDKISFDFTNGQHIPYSKWRSGYKVKIENNKASWIKTNEKQDTYASFRKYMDLIFAYAGTYSLAKQLKTVDLDDIKIGDVFIAGGFPGHAVLVIDMAINDYGKKCMLLAQSYMPAQNIHIIKNFTDSESSPWYLIENIESDNALITPEWKFNINSLKRFE